MTTCKLRIHRLILFLDLPQHKPSCLWLWDPTQRFQITISNDLDAATMFFQRLIVILTPVGSCVVRRYKTSQISQRVTYESSKKVFKTLLGFSFYMWRSLDETLNIFAGLGLFKNLQKKKKLCMRFSID